MLTIKAILTAVRTRQGSTTYINVLWSSCLSSGQIKGNRKNGG